MSTLKVDTLQTTGGAGLYPAKAWVNFDGTGTVAIRADGNVSSVTDNGTGLYVVNFTNSFSGAGVTAGSGLSPAGVYFPLYAISPSASGCSYIVGAQSGPNREDCVTVTTNFLGPE